MAREVTPENDEFRDKYVEIEKEISFDVRSSSGDPETDLLSQLDSEMASIFTRFRPRDWVSVSFQGGDMVSPGSLGVDHFARLNLQDIVSYMAAMEQSSRLNLKNDKITITVKFIHNPSGTGRIADMDSAADVLSYVSKLKCCMDVRALDNNCFSRSCVILIYQMEKGRGKEWQGRKSLLPDQRAAVKAFASHTKSHARVLLQPERNRAKKTLDSMLKDFMEEATLISGQPVSCDDFQRVGQVLSEPKAWRGSYRLMITGANKRLIFKSSCLTANTITLLHTSPGHFMPITDSAAFFANAPTPSLRLGPDYCSACDLHVTRSKHECAHTCPHCKSMGVEEPCTLVDPISCRSCRAGFPSSHCYMSHQEHGVCQTKVCCKRCKRVRRAGQKHVCFTSKCYTCGLDDKNEFHQCYVTGLDAAKLMKKDSKPALFVFYDCETAQLPRDREDGKRVDVHVAVMLHARVICTMCWRGTEEESRAEGRECSCCGRHNKLFKGEQAMSDFANFLMNELDSQFLDRRSYPRDIIVIAHNGKRFDTQLLLAAVCEKGIEITKIVTNGLSVLQATIGHRMKLIDSLSFLMLPLSQLPAAYSLPVTKKNFPHRATARALIDGWDGQWPHLDDFYHDRMTPRDQAALEEWYGQQDKSRDYDFWSVMESYVRDDVTVLMLACMQFRQEYMKMIGTDPFARNITLAGCVMEGLRVTELPVKPIPGSVGLPVNPYCGYDPKKKVSMKSRIWLLFLRQKFFPRMLFEYREGGLIYDGYDRESSTIFEFNGCLYHACPTCFRIGSRTEEVTGNKIINFRDRALRHQLKEERLRRTGKQVISIWEHQYDEHLKNDREFATHERSVRDSVRAVLKAPDTDIREALFGGRVEAISLQAEAGRGRILFKDINSLYPAMLVKRTFAASHPTFIYSDFDYSLEPYFGLVLCTVSPPKQALIGSLPYRHRDKLCFPLCRSCVEEGNESSCSHSPEQRQLRSLWTSMELKHAVKNGYIIDQIQVVLHVEKTMTGSLNPLARYTLRLLDKKIVNSGRAGRNDDQVINFLSELEQMYGITVRPEDLCDNPAARQVAKLALNSLWGRLGMRTDRASTRLVNTFAELVELLTDQTIIVEDTMIVGTKIRVTYKTKTPFIKTPACSSLMNAVFTTAYGRLELKKYMDQLGDRLLYVDSDSIIYKLDEGEEDPITTGEHLGEMADELVKYGTGARIAEFYCGGSKCYCMRIETAEGVDKFIVKMKGIRPNSDTYKKLTFYTMRAAIRKRCNNVSQRSELLDMRAVAVARKEHSNDDVYDTLVKEIDEAIENIDRKIVVDQYRIVPTTYLELHSIIMKKEWRVVYDMRRLLPGGRSVPRGFIDQPCSEISIPMSATMSEGLNVSNVRSVYDWNSFQWDEMSAGRPLSRATVCQLLALVQARNNQHKLCESRVVSDVRHLRDDFSVLNHDLVFIPHLEDNLNWTLFVFDRLKLTITNYDPVRKQTSSALREVSREMNEGCRNSQSRRPGGGTRLYNLNEIDSHNDESTIVVEENNDTRGWEKFYAVTWQHDLPHSNRLGDSGIFIILYADMISRGLDVKTVTPDLVHRFRIDMIGTRNQFSSNSVIVPFPGRSFTVRLPNKV